MQYTKDGENALALHFDDAVVTLNVNIGQRFTGGDLVFLGEAP